MKVLVSEEYKDNSNNIVFFILAKLQFYREFETTKITVFGKNSLTFKFQRI